MIKLRPSSILQLTLTGFAVVALPLITTAGKQQPTMERHARQFQVMNDPQLRDLYRENRDRFLKTVADLRDSDMDGANQALLARLSNAERDQYDQLSEAQAGSEEAEAAPTMVAAT